MRWLLLILVTLNTAQGDEPPAETKEPPQRAHRLNLTGGLTFIFPTLTLSVAASRHFAVSASVTNYDYRAEGGHLYGNGEILTLNYYRESEFSGLWVMAGAGINQLATREIPEAADFSSGSMISTLGWRWKSTEGFNLGFAVGLQYLFNRQIEDIQSTGLFPALILDIGSAIYLGKP